MLVITEIPVLKKRDGEILPLNSLMFYDLLVEILGVTVF